MARIAGVEGDPRQEQRVFVRVADGVHDLGLPRPEQRRQTGAGADLGQGRAPGPAADDPDGLRLLTPWPPCGRQHAWDWPGGGLVQRPARPRDRVQTVGEAQAQPFGAGQGDHGGVVRAVGQGRSVEGETFGRGRLQAGADSPIGRNAAGDNASAHHCKKKP